MAVLPVVGQRIHIQFEAADIGVPLLVPGEPIRIGGDGGGLSGGPARVVATHAMDCLIGCPMAQAVAPVAANPFGLAALARLAPALGSARCS